MHNDWKEMQKAVGGPSDLRATQPGGKLSLVTRSGSTWQSTDSEKTTAAIKALPIVVRRSSTRLASDRRHSVTELVGKLNCKVTKTPDALHRDQIAGPRTLGRKPFVFSSASIELL